MPPSQTSFSSPTPSGLTPNTRSEAESAFNLNAMTQTDSAAPADDGLSEAQRAYRQPGGPIRASSMNYEKAMREVKGQNSASSDLPDETTASEDITGVAPVQSPVNGIAFPPPGKGVVPSYEGIGSGQAEVVKKARNRGLSLGRLGRAPSWNEQDMKHVLQGRLFEQVDSASGYDSSKEEK
ncbi:hypothetical protein P171DRAFT_450901 [Karstenula rhodostoma CBS 690.94]|uniref:Uncharacterized protein n=1 Tax=Karstenula rhodostoma CBS 690.94 TaxID=1392251 RepID=A0A9P4PRZ1_9PLEO|nr:hypothetical protein P171DRAFT_450901 [Karstenula rhodostoma CBS 690.94]